MQDFTRYSYSIQIDKLPETIREATKAGYKAYVIINGEIYDIKPDKERS